MKRAHRWTCPICTNLPNFSVGPKKVNKFIGGLLGSGAMLASVAAVNAPAFATSAPMITGVYVQISPGSETADVTVSGLQRWVLLIEITSMSRKR